jgi:hypothetical protein
MLCAFCYTNFKISTNPGNFLAARGIRTCIIVLLSRQIPSFYVHYKNLQPTPNTCFMYYVVKEWIRKEFCRMTVWNEVTRPEFEPVLVGMLIPGVLPFKNHYYLSCSLFKDAHLPWVIMYIQSLFMHSNSGLSFADAWIAYRKMDRAWKNTHHIIFFIPFSNLFRNKKNNSFNYKAIIIS